jgi:phage-related minor tail protein
LAVLDEYVNQFPGGSLLPEATRLRTEALLALGQKRAALAELNQASASGAAGGEENHLVRGELRAAAGRWREALQDFEVVVRGRLAYEAASGISTSAKLRERFERALWDRASARSHLGDDAGARADLRECWRRFPDGRFAARVAQLLGELP